MAIRPSLQEIVKEVPHDCSKEMTPDNNLNVHKEKEIKCSKYGNYVANIKESIVIQFFSVLPLTDLKTSA